MTRLIIISLALFFLPAIVQSQQSQGCHPCFSEQENKNCMKKNDEQLDSYMLHMAVHPHLDAFWIFDFQSYYDPKPQEGQVRSYFASNRFNSVKEIFQTTLDVLMKSKQEREIGGPATQRTQRSFFNSEIGFFKRWYSELTPEKKSQVKILLSTKHWEIVGGGYVEHDEGCAYYDDIIENFQAGLHFLKDEFNYYPRAAISADSFGHSQTTLAILAHLGVEGFFVERSDEHILLQNKTEFLWKAKSANGQYYGALPTHIRWAIHGFEDQFIGGSINQQICQTKAPFIDNMRRENQFLKRILKSNHIMRYFGHDFQRFDDYSYSVIEGFMEKFSMDKCRKVNAVYSNPTQYFMIMMGEVFNKVKPLAVREEDIMPIWDYDSGLYWTGYYTTDPYHKKIYRDTGRFLYAARKAFTPSYLLDPESSQNKDYYNLLENLSQTVSYLQHHDGISCTSKYEVMDKYEKLAQTQIGDIWKVILGDMFQKEFPPEINNPIFNCSLDSECEVPKSAKGDVYLKVFKTGDIKSPIIVHLQDNQHFQPDCQYEIICMCTADPCPCDLYLYPIIGTYGLIKLTKVDQRPKKAFMLQKVSNADNLISHNKTHLTLKYEQKDYSIGYKRLNGDPTSRNYKHLSRYGDQFQRPFSIRSGKYALGNNINTEENLSEIRKILKLQSERLVKYVVLWKRDNMKTVITINNMNPNQWKVDTYSAAEAGKLEDLYFEVSAPHISNNKKIYTDSNGWLVMKRQMFKHEDYQAHFSPQKYDDVDGNSYPMTAFTYIMNEDGSQKLSVNTDRPQGVTGIKAGSIWINFDRLTSDDGKWVYETAYRAEYQKFTHYITVNNVNNNQRIIQKMIDEPLLIQGQSPSSPNIKYQSQGLTLTETRKTWQQKSGIHRVKFQVKPWNDSSLILRVFNMWDDKQAQIQLFSADNISTFLTAYYGNQLHFMDVYETNMAGNIRYQDFIAKKWNWNNITNLDKENNIFNKEFGQNIKLRPLEIRTFVFDGVSFSKGCKQLKSLRYTNKTQKFLFNTSKPAPARSEKDKLNEKRAAEYLHSGDHCKQISPIKDKTYKIDPQIVAIPDVISKEHELPKMKNPSIANKKPLSEEIQYPQQPQQPQPQPQPQPQQPQSQPQQPQSQPQQPQSQPQQPESQSQPQPQQPQPQKPQPQPQPQPQSPSPSASTSASTSGKSGEFDWKAKLIEYKILTRDQKQMYFNNKLVELKQKLNKEQHKMR